MRFLRLLTLATMLVAPAAATGQVQLARIDGIVLDAADRPLAGVVVMVVDPLGAELRRVSADDRGHFTIVGIAPGRYALTTAGAGAKAAVPVTLTEALPVSVTLRLSPAFRDALVVEGARPASSVASRTSLVGDSIERAPARVRAGGLQAAVATLPGWATEDNGLLHSRGVDDGFLYVIDGVPVYERLDQATGIAPDAASIDTMTVVTGYVPPEFGYKAGGVIEVRTRTAADTWRGLADIGFGGDASADGGLAAGGGVGRGATLWVGASGQRTDRFLDPVHPDNLHNRGGHGSASGQLSAGSGVRDRVTASWHLGRSSFDVPNSRMQNEAGQAQRQRTAQGALTASWQRTWSSRTLSQAAGYVRRGRARLDASPFDTPLTASADRRLTRAGALVGVTRQAAGHLLKAGAELQQIRISERFGFAVTDRDEAEDAGLSESALAFDVADPFEFAGRARPTLFSMYVQDAWQPAADLTIAAGLRYDRTRLLLERQQWSPRIGLAYALGPQTTVRASLSRFYQPPQPENLLLASSEHARALSPFADGAARAGGEPNEDDESVAGGAEVEPERQWAFESGVEHRVAHGVRLDIAYWRRHVDEYADPNVFFGTTIIFPNAVAEGRAQGVDARLEVLPRGPWSGYANLSVGAVRQRGPITGGLFLEEDVADVGPGVEFTPDHDQRVVSSAGLTWTGGRGAVVSAVWRYESGTPIELDDDAEADELAGRPGADLVDFDRGRVRPRTLVSLLGSVRVWQSAHVAMSVRASVLNLFGARYAYNFGNPFSGTHFGAPRTAAVTVRLETR